MTLVPSMVSDISIFCTILDDLATSGKVVQIEELAAQLTIDIMAHVALDHSLHSQTGNSDLINAFRMGLRWASGSSSRNPLEPYNPVTKVMQWWYARKMDRILEEILDGRYKAKAAEAIEAARDGSSKRSRRKPVIDLVSETFCFWFRTDYSHLTPGKLSSLDLLARQLRAC